jgi:hypothetical protein
MRRASKLAALMLSMCLLAPSVAHAGAIIGVNDPNDTKGKLDVNRFEGVRTVSGGAVAYKITFHDPVKNATLDALGNFVKVMLDTDSDDIADYTGTVVYGQGKFGIIFAGSGSILEALKVKHPNARTFTFVTPAGAPLSPNGPLGAKALTAYTSKTGFCNLICVDEVPSNGNWIAL